ncbi:hypothetical protein [Mesorhizobium sp.]|uniref:hypothetical protein n=1 Tax=Mesorhizobium sp. TaxID=1871066 RepID=UPI0012164BC5|nr:hypothetical protein [Mesorhizobium sp.]TIN82651.1 MAG: hypothetical protein E5X97_29260 [Mesorhizobium sp.]
MVATVGSISIDLVTNAAKFASGFKSSATTVEQQSSRMAKSIASLEKNTALAAGTLKTFVGGLAAGAGLAALTSLGGAFDKLKETISQFDEIATNAKTVGLKSDTFQALAFAAQQANISQENFNSSLTIFAKNAGLAEKGTGALFAGLKKLNPELLRNILSTDDQEKRLDAVADAMAKTRDATERLALSTVIFGKGGAEMSRILEGGRKSIEAMKKSAQDMGIIIPDELLQKGGELDDKLDLLSKIIDVQLSQSLIKLAPLLVGATQGFADFTKEVNANVSAIDNFVKNPSLENLNKILGPGLLSDAAKSVSSAISESGRSADAIKADIAEIQQKLADLQAQAETGLDVDMPTSRLLDDLQALQQELAKTQAAGVTAANAIRASFAQAFRESENASMAALKEMNRQAGNSVNVTRYGAPANSVIPGSTYQTDVNNSGVAVRKYGGTSLSSTGGRTEQSDVNGSGVDVTKYNSDTADNTKETAGYARDTADNISDLHRDTGGYFRDLGSTVDSGAATISHSVSSLADLIGNEFGQLPSYLIAALQAQGGALNTGSISQPSTMFGPNWDPQHGSHVGDVINLGRAAHWVQPSYSDDGSYNTTATVSQPGNSYTLNYTAAPGDSVETTKQKARAAFQEMINAAASA